MQERRLATPSAVRSLLARYGIRPRKGLGQSFLVDGNIVDKITAAARVDAHDVVLEIGPGLGTLTQALAARAGRVVAVEIDARLAAILEDLFASRPNVQVVRADALTADLPALITPHLTAATPPALLKVVANLPYYVTSPLIFRILESPWPLDTAVLMVQREVADRLTAAPGSKAYGSLTVAVAARAAAELVAPVPRTVFLPQPDVDSAIVRLTMSARPLDAVDPRAFSAAVRAAFGQRRKTLRRALQGGGWDPAQVQAALEAAAIDGGRRGETLTPEEFARLAAALPLPAGGKTKGGQEMEPKES